MPPSPDDHTKDQEAKAPASPDRANDGPVQSRKADDKPDRQIAQDQQQSTGLGSGQT